MRAFDAKFGPDFLAGVPESPGVYRIFDDADTLIYVGKAANLRRRLAQYRTMGRRKAHRKRRTLVRAAARIAWEVCESELDASLVEIRLIQELRPPRNVVAAFPFLYPFIGIRDEGVETYFCMTTSPAAFPGFDLHGAFRSRELTGEAFAALARLLRWPGHPVPRHRCVRLVAARHSRVIGFRRLPAGSSARWAGLLRGESREPLEALALELLEHPGARARSAEIQDDLRAVGRFFRREAALLARARASAGYAHYPVPQEDRDLVFTRYRHAGA